MKYVDGFVMVIPTKKLAAYKRLAAGAGRIWMEHGALDYKECVGDDMKTHCGLPFPRLTKLKRGECVIFSWITYKSRAHRDKVNARVMSDPRLEKLCDPNDLPFDLKRMSHGGFRTLVDL